MVPACGNLTEEMRAKDETAVKDVAYAAKKNELKNLPLSNAFAGTAAALAGVVERHPAGISDTLYLAGEALMQLVTAPVRQLGIAFIYVNLAEALSAQMKVALLAAVLLTLPLFCPGRPGNLSGRRSMRKKGVMPENWLW